MHFLFLFFSFLFSPDNLDLALSLFLGIRREIRLIGGDDDSDGSTGVRP